MASPGRSKRRPLSADQLHDFKYFKLLRKLLEHLHDNGTARDKAGNRELFYDQYVSLLLLAFFNPVITSLKGIQQATELDKVRKVLGVKRTSTGSLSEASTLFDPALLREIVQELAAHLVPAQNQDLSDREREALAGLTAVDGSVLRALPRMLWAFWRLDRYEKPHYSARLNLHFDILKGVPCDATVTSAREAESASLRPMLQAGHLYVLDRGFAHYGLFRAIIDAQSSFVARVKDNVVFTVAEERPISKEARAAGVVSDTVVDRLGVPSTPDYLQQPVRLVVVDTTTREGNAVTLWLLTDRLDLDAELIAVAYRYRWSVELFFRWFKCVLGCRHLMAESQNGVTIQCYAALIASLLITLWTGLHPNKRTWEMIQFYLMGWATVEELERHLEKRRLTEATSKLASAT